MIPEDGHSDSATELLSGSREARGEERKKERVIDV